MADSAIEWTDKTWNPTRGCTRVSRGCERCYAERQARRHSGPGGHYEGLVRITNGRPQWTGEVRCLPGKLSEPHTWRKPCRVFVDSMSDLFHEGVPFEFIDQVFAAMVASPQHTFQVLTKRPTRMLAYFQAGDGWRSRSYVENRAKALLREQSGHPEKPVLVGKMLRWPLPNVWLGVSVEDQATADERIPLLLRVPAAVRWLSLEPLLGPVDLSEWLRWECSRCGDEYHDADGDWAWLAGEMHPIHRCYRESLCPNFADGRPRIGWAVVGGESGLGARPMHPDWAREIRDDCQNAEVPFFFKQHGEWIGRSQLPADWSMPMTASGPALPIRLWLPESPGDYSVRLGKKRAGRVLDGREWSEFPA